MPERRVRPDPRRPPEDSVVEGHLSGIAGHTQETYGGRPKEVRPKLDEAAKRKPDSDGR